MERMDELLAEEAELNFPKTSPLMGKTRVIRFFNILFRRYPELFFRVRDTIIEGQKAAVHWKNSGVSRKGEIYENEGITLFKEGSQGRISIISDFFKDTEKF
jgi:ketosteroid isomerase-like protein